MSLVCEVTGKKAMSGHNVSHSNRKTNRWFKVNIFTKRFWSPIKNRFVKLTVSRKGMRIIDKKGIDAVLADIEAQKAK